MQVDNHLICPICSQICANAVESSCCTQLFCQKCAESIKCKFKACPMCRSGKFQINASKIARRMISSIKIQCPNNCGSTIDFGDRDAHNEKCPQAKMVCKFCEMKLKASEIISHSIAEHKKEAYQIIQKMNKPSNSKPENSKLKSNIEQMFSLQIVSPQGKMLILGTTGKYYCGGDLIGKCTCCDGKCGPTNGENCDFCMSMDIKRRSLANGYLVNSDGYPTKRHKNTLIYYCMRSQPQSNKGVQCNQRIQCFSCIRLTDSIKIGRYKGLIQ